MPLRHQRKGPHGSDKAVPPHRGRGRLVGRTSVPVSTKAAGQRRVVGEEALHELGAGHAGTVREGVGVVGLETRQALRQAPLARHRLRVATVMTPASAHNKRIRALLALWRITQLLHIPRGGGCVGKVDRVCTQFHLSRVPALIWFRLWPGLVQLCG